MPLLHEIESALKNPKFARRVAFIDRCGELRFEEVTKRIVEAQTLLKATGFRTGTRIAAITLNCSQAVILEWATYRLNGIWIGVPAKEREPRRIAGLINACQPLLLFVDPAALTPENLDNLLHFLGLEFNTRRDLNGLDYFSLECSRSHPKFKIGRQRAVRVRFTSGVTGEPKAVLYTQKTHRAIFDNISRTVLRKPRGKVASVVRRHQPEYETMIHCMPTAWASGSLIAPVFARGGCSVLMTKWNLVEFVRAVRKHKCTLTFLLPKLLGPLVKHSKRHGSEWANSLRRVLLAGAPTPVKTMGDARHNLQRTTFFTTFGMTEASFPITWHEVVEKDVGVANSRAYVPLGELSEFYRLKGRETKIKSPKDGRGELLVDGHAVAAARWIWQEGGRPRVKPLKGSRQPYPSGDIVESDSKGVIHYVCRAEAPWAKKRIWIASDAIEALLRECPGVKECRVDQVVQAPDKLKVSATVEPSGGPIEEAAVRKFFERNAGQAHLIEAETHGQRKPVVLDDVRFGKIAMTSTGKVARNYAFSNLRPGLRHASSWKRFDFSLLQGEPLYFYVGAGLSQAAGLVGWRDMARILWWHLTSYEGNDPNFPDDNAEENAQLLDDFVNHPFPLGDRQAWSREDIEHQVLGRVALLNMLLRYREPKIRLKGIDKGRNPQFDTDPYCVRCGEEPIAEDLVLHSLIWRANCHGVLTPNYDMLLEHAYSLFDHGAALRSYRYSADFLRYIMSNPKFILKLHGDINDVGRMLFHPDKAWEKGEKDGKVPGQLAKQRGSAPEPEKVTYGGDLKMVYQTALQWGHMIYVGMGFRDRTILELHSHWLASGISSPNVRVALLCENELEGIKAELKKKRANLAADTVKNNYKDIVFLTYNDTSKPAVEVREFLSCVVDARAHHRSDQRRPCKEATDIHHQIFQSPQSLRLKRRWETEPWTVAAKAARRSGKPTPS